MTTTLFQTTGADDFPSFLKMMVSGPPKSGKTTLLGTVPNIVIADTEPFANNLASIAHKNVPYTTIYSSNDLMRLRYVLGDEQLRAKAAEQLGLPKIEAVAIDTFDTLQALMKKERMATTGHEFQRDDWGWMKEEMTQIVQSFMSLPMHVILTVHLKSKELGKGDSARTIIQPGLEGAIAESVAGMVGYSVLSYRRQDIRPDGTKYTRYMLRTEGDETYDFLGTRTAGRLPETIDPDFATILKAAMDGRPNRQPAPVEFQQGGEQISVATSPAPETAPTQAPAAQPPAAQEQVAQNLVQSESQPPVAPGQAPAAALKPEDDAPVNAAALMHVKKIYDALGLQFPEEDLKTKTLGDARNLVRAWQAIQADAAQGKGEGTPQQVMTDYLLDMEMLTSDDHARLKAARDVGTDQGRPAALEGNADHPADPVRPASLAECKTIKDVEAYVGDELPRIQEAYDAETAKDSPRSSLVDMLTRKGATVRTPVENKGQDEPTPEPTAAVTQQPAPADAPATPTEEKQGTEQAVAALENGLGAVKVAEEIDEDSLCARGLGTANEHKIDDVDIARLSLQRPNIQEVLCVTHYLDATKAQA